MARIAISLSLLTLLFVDFGFQHELPECENALPPDVVEPFPLQNTLSPNANTSHLLRRNHSTTTNINIQKDRSTSFYFHNASEVDRSISSSAGGDHKGLIQAGEAFDEDIRHFRECIIIDGGSTGTRTHIFRYFYNAADCDGLGSVSIELPERSYKISPGLTTLLEHSNKDINFSISSRVASYLEPLKTFLYKEIDLNYRKDSIILFRGTAGIRHLIETTQADLLASIEESIKSWGFWFELQWAASVLTGEEEGLMSWLLTNQLLGNFMPEYTFVNVTNYNLANFFEKKGTFSENVIQYNKTNGTKFAEKLQTHSDSFSTTLSGLVEMGGASAQVVLPISELELSRHTASNATKKFTFCGLTLPLYVKSFLGFGRQLALQKHLQKVVKHSDNEFAKIPCLHNDVEIQIEVDAVSLKENLNEFTNLMNKNSKVAIGTSNYEQCLKDIEEHFELYDSGDIPRNIPRLQPIVATENFYFFNEFVVMKEKRPHMNAKLFKEKARELCPLSSLQVKEQIHPAAEQEKAETACFGLLFMSGFLSQFLKIHEEHSLHAIKTISDVEISWVGGYLLYELPKIFSELKFRNSLSTRERQSTTTVTKTSSSITPASISVLLPKDEF